MRKLKGYLPLSLFLSPSPSIHPQLEQSSLGNVWGEAWPWTLRDAGFRCAQGMMSVVTIDQYSIDGISGIEDWDRRRLSESEAV